MSICDVKGVKAESTIYCV